MPDNSVEGLARDVCLLGVGAYTPIGPDAASSAASARAGIAGFAAHPLAKDVAGEPVITARIAELESLSGALRFQAMAAIAAKEALAPILKIGRELRGRFQVEVGLPEGRPGRPDGLESAVSEGLRSLIIEVAPQHEFKTRAEGHASGLLALKEAAASIRKGRAELSLVGGVESYDEPETLAWLEANEQLNGAGFEGNPWGFVPGEGAAFALIGSRETAELLGLPILGECVEIGSAIEAKRIKTDDVCTGEGLTKAFREALRPYRDLIDRCKVNSLYCDINGEPYRSAEFAYAIARHAEFFVEPGTFRAPADCWGDVGAASGLLGLVLAWAAADRGYAEGPSSLVWASSEGGLRAAVLLHLETRKEETV